MKHTHLTLNTAVTIITLIIICVLLYWVTVKQDTRYQDILTLIDKQQTNLDTEQRLRQGLERAWYNWKATQLEKPMGEITIKAEDVK